MLKSFDVDIITSALLEVPYMCFLFIPDVEATTYTVQSVSMWRKPFLPQPIFECPKGNDWHNLDVEFHMTRKTLLL